VSLSLKCASLHNRGVALAKDFYATKPPAQAVKVFTTFLTEARNISTAAASASQGLRVPPVVIWLEGGPGTGKTNCVQAIVRAVCAKLDIPNPESQIFQKPDTSDYWNGYCNQLAMLIDDFGQSTDVAERRMQALNLIYAASTNPYILDMADVNSKGNFSFTSRLVFITTNMAELTQVGLTSDEALRRRVDIRSQVKSRPEFALTVKGVVSDRVDPRKLSARLGVPCEYNAHAIHYHSLLGDQTLLNADTEKKTLTFTTMVDTIIAMLDDKHRYFRQAVNNEALAPLLTGDVSPLSPEENAAVQAQMAQYRTGSYVERMQEVSKFDVNVSMAALYEEALVPEIILSPRPGVPDEFAPEKPRFDPTRYFSFCDRR